MLALLTLGLTPSANANTFVFQEADVLVDEANGSVTIHGYDGVDGESFGGPGAVVFATGDEALSGFLGWIKAVEVEDGVTTVVMTIDDLHLLETVDVSEGRTVGWTPSPGGQELGAIGIWGTGGTAIWGTDGTSIWGTGGTAVWGADGAEGGEDAWGIWGTGGTAIWGWTGTAGIWGTGGTAIWGTGGTAHEGETVRLVVGEMPAIDAPASAKELHQIGFGLDALIDNGVAVDLGEHLHVEMEMISPRDAASGLCTQYTCVD